MGKIKRLNKKGSIETDVKVIDPKPIWVGIIEMESGKQISRFMTADEAERWVKEEPGRKVRMYTTAGALRQME